MSYGEKGRVEGYGYEKIIEANANSYSKNSSRPSKQGVESILGGTTTSKSDTSINSHNISIKNPGRSGASIQMFVTSQKNIFKGCACDNPDIGIASKLFFGTPDEEEFENLLVQYEIKKEELSYNEETRRRRLKFFSLPQKHQSVLLEFLNTNKRHLVECALRKGWAKDPQSYADFMLWSDSSVGGKSSLEHMCLFDIEDVIDKVCEHDWAIRPSETVFELGPLTLQMKGSGKGMSKHNFQFKASLDGLRGAGIPYISGNSNHMFAHLEAK